MIEAYLICMLLGLCATFYSIVELGDHIDASDCVICFGLFIIACTITFTGG